MRIAEEANVGRGTMTKRHECYYKNRSERSRSQSKRRRRQQAIDMHITRRIRSGARRGDKKQPRKYN